MSKEFTVDRLEEELKKSQSKCAELETEILRKDDAIRKLTAELAEARRQGYSSLEERIRRRREALEICRIEYENRVGCQTHLCDTNNEGDDEID